MPQFDRRDARRFLVVAPVSLAIATIAIAVLQDGLGVPNPSALYLVAVVATAIVSGTWGAVLASIASFLLYNFLFVDPRYTLTVAQPGELVNLLLLLFVGIVVGQLAALQRARAEMAIAREREARALFQVSRALATRESTPAVLPGHRSDPVRETAHGAHLDRPRSRTTGASGSPPTRATGHGPPPAATRCSSGCRATRRRAGTA